MRQVRQISDNLKIINDTAEKTISIIQDISRWRSEYVKVTYEEAKAIGIDTEIRQ